MKQSSKSPHCPQTRRKKRNFNHKKTTHHKATTLSSSMSIMYLHIQHQYNNLYHSQPTTRLPTNGETADPDLHNTTHNIIPEDQIYKILSHANQDQDRYFK